MKVNCNYCDWVGSFADAVLGNSINAHKKARGRKVNKTKIRIGDSGKFHCPECYQPVKILKERV